MAKAITALKCVSSAASLCAPPCNVHKSHGRHQALNAGQLNATFSGRSSKLLGKPAPTKLNSRRPAVSGVASCEKGVHRPTPGLVANVEGRPVWLEYVVRHSASSGAALLSVPLLAGPGRAEESLAETWTSLTDSVKASFEEALPPSTEEASDALELDASVPSATQEVDSSAPHASTAIEVSQPPLPSSEPLQSALAESPTLPEAAVAQETAVEAAPVPTVDTAEAVLSDAEAAQDFVESVVEGTADPTSTFLESAESSAPSPPTVDVLDVPSVLESAEEGAVDATSTVMDSAESIILEVTPSAPPVQVPELPELPSVVQAAAGAGNEAEPAVSQAADTAVKSAADRYKELLGGSVPSSGPVQTGPEVDPITAVQEAVTNAISAAKAAVTGAADATSSAVQGTINAGSEAVNSAVKTVTGIFQASEGGLSETLEASKGAVEGTAKQLSLPPLPKLPPISVPPAVTKAIGGVVDSVKEAAGVAAGEVGKAVGQAYSSVKEQLPPDAVAVLDTAEDKIREAAGPTAVFLQQAFTQITIAANSALRAAEVAAGVDPDDPSVVFTITAAAVFAGSSVLLFSYWKLVSAGYAGDLSPEESLKLLREEFNAVLVDIRSQEKRDAEGIPDLRRGARFKDAAVEFSRISGPIKSQLKNADVIDLQLLAAKVRGLKGVGGGTKVIVMDESGAQSKEVARALRKFGGIQRTYRLVGGYQAWAETQRIKDDVPESPITVIQQEAEAFVEEVQPTPLGVTAVLVGFGLAGYAVFEWEKSLQLLGVLGVVQLVYSRARTYESIEDVKADIKAVLKPFTLVAAGAIWVGSLIDKNQSPALATTSPSGYTALPSSEDEEREEDVEESADASSEAVPQLEELSTKNKE